MANPNMQITLNLSNVLIGVGFVLVAMLIFRLLLPAVLPIDLVLTIASAAAGVAFWFLFLISRNRAG
jgi:hypothetical protein